MTKTRSAATGRLDKTEGAAFCATNRCVPDSREGGSGRGCLAAQVLSSQVERSSGGDVIRAPQRCSKRRASPNRAKVEVAGVAWLAGCQVERNSGGDVIRAPQRCSKRRASPTRAKVEVAEVGSRAVGTASFHKSISGNRTTQRSKPTLHEVGSHEHIEHKLQILPAYETTY